MLARLAADAVLVVHLAFIVFAVAGAAVLGVNLVLYALCVRRWTRQRGRIVRPASA